MALNQKLDELINTNSQFEVKINKLEIQLNLVTNFLKLQFGDDILLDIDNNCDGVGVGVGGGQGQRSVAGADKPPKSEFVEVSTTAQPQPNNNYFIENQHQELHNNSEKDYPNTNSIPVTRKTSTTESWADDTSSSFGGSVGGGGGRRTNRGSTFSRGGGGNGPRESRPGDWLCERCGGNNFSVRYSCFKCGIKKPSGSGDSRNDVGSGSGGNRSIGPGGGFRGGKSGEGRGRGGGGNSFNKPHLNSLMNINVDDVDSGRPISSKGNKGNKSSASAGGGSNPGSTSSKAPSVSGSSSGNAISTSTNTGQTSNPIAVEDEVDVWA